MSSTPFESSYIPALRFHWLTSAYDTLLALTFPEKKIKSDVVRTVNAMACEKILDFGVGTATLSIMAYHHHQNAQYFGVDIDQKILDIAGKKVIASDAKVELVKYNGTTLPYKTGSFDSVMSCLVFHHLNTEVKLEILVEIRRVLKANGKLVIADFGKPKTRYARIAFRIFSWFDGISNIQANANGLLPQLMEEAGFAPVEEVKSYNTAFGTMQLLLTTKH